MERNTYSFIVHCRPLRETYDIAMLRHAEHKVWISQ